MPSLEYAAEGHGIPLRAAKAAFFDNRRVSETFLNGAPAENETVPTIEISPAELTSEELPLRIRDATLFDTVLTYFTVFLATDEGLLSAPLHVGRHEASLELQKRLSYECYQATPRWGP